VTGSGFYIYRSVGRHAPLSLRWAMKQTNSRRTRSHTALRFRRFCINALLYFCHEVVVLIAFRLHGIDSGRFGFAYHCVRGHSGCLKRLGGMCGMCANTPSHHRPGTVHASSTAAVESVTSAARALSDDDESFSHDGLLLPVRPSRDAVRRTRTFT